MHRRIDVRKLEKEIDTISDLDANGELTASDIRRGLIRAFFVVESGYLHACSVRINSIFNDGSDGSAADMFSAYKEALQDFSYELELAKRRAGEEAWRSEEDLVAMDEIKQKAFDMQTTVDRAVHTTRFQEET